MGNIFIKVYSNRHKIRVYFDQHSHARSSHLHIVVCAVLHEKHNFNDETLQIRLFVDEPSVNTSNCHFHCIQFSEMLVHISFEIGAQNALT